MKENFNLVDEKWIPIEGGRLCSLKEIFTEKDLPNLGGNPIQKIALMKLLLAITHAAYTPEDDNAWQKTLDILPQECTDYLTKWHDRFYLYGEKPFLQMPQVKEKGAESKSINVLSPEISTGNTTLLFNSQYESKLSDEEKVLVVLVTNGFGIGGKRKGGVGAILSESYSKTTTLKYGALLGSFGYLHTYFLSDTLLKSIWLNLLTSRDIADIKEYDVGIGVPPWEKMPLTEDCDVAKKLKNSLMGDLVPMSEFCIISKDDNNVYCTDGILYPDPKDGGINTTISLERQKRDIKVLWTKPDKRPWRSLTSMLSFLGNESGLQNRMLYYGIKRVKTQYDFYIWSGGLSLKNTSGEQKVSGGNDYVESVSHFENGIITEAGWYTHWKAEMNFLDKMEKTLYASVSAYYKEFMVNKSELAGQATNNYWQLCEALFQGLINACGAGKQKDLRKKFAQIINDVYDQFCPKETARQITAWAKCRPNLSKYLKSEAI